jgi:hypothetical protein
MPVGIQMMKAKESSSDDKNFLSTIAFLVAIRAF